MIFCYLLIPATILPQNTTRLYLIPFSSQKYLELYCAVMVSQSFQTDTIIQECNSVFTPLLSFHYAPLLNRAYTFLQTLIQFCSSYRYNIFVNIAITFFTLSNLNQALQQFIISNCFSIYDSKNIFKSFFTTYLITNLS